MDRKQSYYHWPRCRSHHRMVACSCQATVSHSTRAWFKCSWIVI